MRFILGENLGKVSIFFGDRWRSILRGFICSGKIFRERNDFIEMQEIDFIVGIDFCGKAYLRRDTWRFQKRILRFLLFPAG